MSTGVSTYKPFWETQSADVPIVQNNKYGNVAPTPAAGLMHGNIYNTIYQRTTGPHSRAIVRTGNSTEPKRTFKESNAFTVKSPVFTEPKTDTKVITSLAKKVEHKNSAQARFERNKVEGRHDDRWDTTAEEAFTHRPTHGWESSYSDTFQAWKTKAKNDEDRRQEKALPDYSDQYMSRQGENEVYRGSFRYNDLRKTPAASGYTTDFGKFGDNPKDRLKHSTDLSAISTSRDLAKGGERRNVVPGYTGYLPQNSNGLRDNPSQRVKDDLLFTFRHDMPGYTGYKPKNVANDRGARVPTSLAKDIAGMHAGLIVESMSVKGPPNRVVNRGQF